jgi:hypothetical protein
MPYDKVTAELRPVIAKLSEGNNNWLARSGALENPAVLVHLYRSVQLAGARAKLGGTGNG